MVAAGPSRRWRRDGSTCATTSESSASISASDERPEVQRSSADSCRPPHAAPAGKSLVSWSGRSGDDGQRTSNLGLVALAVLPRDGQAAPGELGDGLLQTQLPAIVGQGLELSRQVLARSDTIYREISRDRQALQIQTSTVIVHADQDARQRLLA